MKTAFAFLLACIAVSADARALETPPTPGPPHEFRLPSKQTAVLPNGIAVTFLEYGNVPKVTLLAVVRTGSIDEGERTWLSDLTAEMMKQGTTTRTAADIARTAAEMGGSLGIGSGAEQTTAGISVLSEHAGNAAALLADVLRRPALPEAELARIAANFERNLSVAQRDADSLAGEALARLVYGDHPFGHTMPQPGQVASYGIDEVRRFYTDNFGAARTRIYVAGRFDRAALLDALIVGFGDWRAGPAPSDNPPVVSEILQLALVGRPGAPQSSVRMAVAAPGPADTDYFPFTVTNTLLGGSSTSRIYLNLREEKGYTYTPWSSLQAYRKSAAWVVSADVATEHTADSLREIYEEISLLGKVPPGDAELEAIKRYRAGIFVIRNSSPQGLLGQLAFMDLYGLPDEFLTRWIERVDAVTPGQVSDMVRHWIDPTRMSVVVVGDLGKIASSVEALPQLRDARRVEADR